MRTAHHEGRTALEQAVAQRRPAPGGFVGLALGGDLLALSWPADAAGEPPGTSTARDPGGTAAELAASVEEVLQPRWVWWSAEETAAPLVAAGCRATACWDLAAVHRLIHGGWHDEPALVWAAARGLRPDGIPRSGQLDLLALPAPAPPGTGAPPGDGVDARPDDPDDPVQPDGYLRPGAGTAAWLGAGDTRRRLARWAELALDVRAAQEEQLAGRRAGGDVRTTARAESAAALLCVELGQDGLPIDVAAAESVIGASIGPRPRDEAERLLRRAERDERVLRHAPDAGTDLRNPQLVRNMLSRTGIDLPDTRSWRLKPLVGVHPVVEALLEWRKAERIETTYGYTWLDRHVGADGRLRGRWHASDGAAGRMTAQAGLHNLPAELRSAVVAPAGHLFVRADLGQIEPRVLAAVSADPSLGQAAGQDDLYAPVAAALSVERAVAKVAVLAAMYGQRSGAAGAALERMEAAFPQAMSYLRAADGRGRGGEPVTTYGGRVVRVGPIGAAADEQAVRAAAAARGRFTRNAVIQGAAAELFKAWAVTVRRSLAGTGARIVLCLHDELLVEVPEDDAPAVGELLLSALTATAGRWFGGSPVRFVADVSVVKVWSHAKG